jgi:hypothetical protein
MIANLDLLSCNSQEMILELLIELPMRPELLVQLVLLALESLMLQPP